MIVGKLAGGQISNKLPFQLIISTVRRKKLMGNSLIFFSESLKFLFFSNEIDALMSGDEKKKSEGEKVLTVLSAGTKTPELNTCFKFRIMPSFLQCKKEAKKNKINLMMKTTKWMKKAQRRSASQVSLVQFLLLN